MPIFDVEHPPRPTRPTEPTGPLLWTALRLMLTRPYFVLVTQIAWIPVLLCWAFVWIAMPEGDFFDFMAGGIVLTLGVALALLVSGPLTLALMAKPTMDQLDRGWTPTRRGPAAIINRWFSLAVLWVLVYLVIGVTSGLILPLLLPLLHLAHPVMAVEGGNPIRALARSWDLLRGRWIATILLTTLVYTTQIVALAVPLALALGSSDWPSTEQSLIGALGAIEIAALSATFNGIVAAAAYRAWAAPGEDRGAAMVEETAGVFD